MYVCMCLCVCVCVGKAMFERNVLKSEARKRTPSPPQPLLYTRLLQLQERKKCVQVFLVFAYGKHYVKVRVYKHNYIIITNMFACDAVAVFLVRKKRTKHFFSLIRC